MTITVSGQGRVTNSVTSDQITGPGQLGIDLSLGATVNLLAINDQPTNWIFSGWSGACSGVRTCTVTMDADKNVVATYSLNPVMQDCLPYEPANLRIVDEGGSGWLLTDGFARMFTLDTQADAQAALALAQQYTNRCFIGRNNQRPSRSDYIAVYWEGGAGQPPNGSNEDCLPYSPTALTVVDEGASGWLLTDGRSRMLTLDNATDAQSALAVAQRHTSHCFIGRGNQRANRANYVLEYWR